MAVRGWKPKGKPTHKRPNRKAVWVGSGKLSGTGRKADFWFVRPNITLFTSDNFPEGCDCIDSRSRVLWRAKRMKLYIDPYREKA